MKAFPLIYISIFLLFSCNNAEQNNHTEKQVSPNTTQSAETKPVPNDLNFKIPESSDPELNAFFKAYTSHLNEYVAAVRGNNKQAIKQSFDREKKFRIQLLDLPARLQKDAPAEWEKYESYRSHTAKYMNEIEKTDYVKSLHEEALKSF